MGVFGVHDSQDVGNRAASEEGTVVSGNGQPQPGRILPAGAPARCGQGTRPLWTRDAQPHRLWGPHGLHWPRRKADWVKAAGGNSEEVA